MGFGWLVLGVTVMMMSIHWSMQRSVRRQREQRLARLLRPADLRPNELHCPHCGHVIGDVDFTRVHPPFVPRAPHESPYFRRPHDAS